MLRLIITAFFRITDVTTCCKLEEGWYGQLKYCFEKAIEAWSRMLFMHLSALIRLHLPPPSLPCQRVNLFSPTNFL